MCMSLVTQSRTSSRRWLTFPESGHTYEWVKSHIWRCHRSHVARMHESSHTQECGMSQIGMCHATHINMSCHTYACGTSRTHLWCGAHLQKKPSGSGNSHVILCGRNFRALLQNRIGCFIISTPRGVGCPKIANSLLQKALPFSCAKEPHPTLRYAEKRLLVFLYIHTDVRIHECELLECELLECEWPCQQDCTRCSHHHLQSFKDAVCCIKGVTLPATHTTTHTATHPATHTFF